MPEFDSLRTEMFAYYSYRGTVTVEAGSSFKDRVLSKNIRSIVANENFRMVKFTHPPVKHDLHSLPSVNIKLGHLQTNNTRQSKHSNKT